MSHDAAYAFWLRFAEARGAVVEEGPEQALAVLPPDLQAELGVGEALAVTTDPGVAEEEGAVLLTPGHPVLERAVAAALAGGDAGLVWPPWPRPLPPGADVLLARARERIPVEHGRIDPAGAPAAVFAPVLRVGALCTHTLDEQFQERLEAWVDARTGLSLPEAQIRRWREAPAAEGADAAHPVLQPRLDAALAAADALLAERALARGAELARQAQAALRAERQRAEAYYAAVLDAAARRREGAPPERQALLDRQAEVTAAERERRLLEITDKFRPRHDLRHFRLHLVLAPALHFPVWVRRGERRFAFALCWSLQAADFLPPACPRCGSGAPLSAGREALGCVECLAPKPAAAREGGRDGDAGAIGDGGGAWGAEPMGERDGTAHREPAASRDAAGNREGSENREAEGQRDRATAGVREAAAARAGAGGPAGTAGARGRGKPGQAVGPAPAAAGGVAAAREGARGQEVAGRRSAQPGGAGGGRDGTAAKRPAAAGRTRPAVPLDRSGRPTPRPRDAGHEGERLRHQAAFAFLRSLIGSGGLPAPMIAPHSPLAVAVDLWGRSGPLLAVGLPLAVPPDEARLGPVMEDRLLPPAVSGVLQAGRTPYAFTLRWSSAGPAAAFAELLPVPDGFDAALPPRDALPPDVAARLFEGAPPPRAGLDAVERAIWDHARPGFGVPLFLRCLAAWRRLPPGNRQAADAPLAAAAGLLHLVGRRGALRPTYNGLATDFGVDPAAVQDAAAQLARALGLYAARFW